MNNAFKEFADCNFDSGLCALAQDPAWQDDSATLDGPFCLGFPKAAGWGEELLTASLLKRHASATNKQIKVFARPQVCSILKHDGAFSLCEVLSFDEGRLAGGRSPLAVLRQALLGDLLDKPFKKIETDARHNAARTSVPRIGIAWASKQPGSSKKTILEKSIELGDFLPALDGIDADFVSFQRGLTPLESEQLSHHFKCRCRVLSEGTLISADQSEVVREICQLSCMITISTTTAHIAASLGVPVVLVVKKRSGQQWFWITQNECRKCIYPSVQIIIGAGDPWWKVCIAPAARSLQRSIEASALPLRGSKIVH